MDTRPRIVSLASALAVVALCGCSRPAADSVAAAPDIPEADVEGSPLPPTIDPTVVQRPSKQLDWSMEGHDDIAASAEDSEGREAALRYMRGQDADATSGEADAAPEDETDSAEVAAAPARDPKSVDDARPAEPETRAAAARATDPDDRPRTDETPPPARPAAAAAPVAASGDARSLNRQAIAAINAGRPAQAIPLLERAIAQQPRDPEMLGNLGYAYMLIGEHRRARDRLRTALDLSPTRSATWLNLGQTYAELGQQDVAVDAVVTGYRYSTRKASVRSALQRAVAGDRHSAAWREAAALALSRIG